MAIMQSFLKNKGIKHGHKYRTFALVSTVGSACLIAAVVMFSSTGGSSKGARLLLGGPCSPSLQISADSEHEQLNSRDAELISSFVAFNSSLTAALDVLVPKPLAAVLKAWQLHTCAVTSVHGYVPTVAGHAAKRANTKAGFSMYIYPTNDIVSGYLAQTQSSESGSSMKSAKSAMPSTNLSQQRYKQLQPPAAARHQLPCLLMLAQTWVCSLSALPTSEQGCTPLKAQAQGLADNVRLIQASLCTNPVLQHQVTFFPLGLSAKNDTCWVIAGTGNMGDGFTMCGHNSSEQAQAAAPEGYTVRSSMLVRRLDDLVQEDVKVMKMDVEGHDYSILQGATQLLTKHRIWYILAEANQGIIGQEGAYKLVKFLMSQGYRISTKGFRGPWVTEAQVEGQSVRWRGINVFAAHEDLWGPVV